MEGTIYDGDMFKLTTDNYSYWKPMMEDHLYCKDMHEPISYIDKPEGKSDKDWELLNRKNVAMIRNYIDRSFFEHMSTYTNVYELCLKLESMIQKKTLRNKAYLVKRLVKLDYTDGQSMMEHLNSFKGLVNQLTKIDMKIDDEFQALFLLILLPESWETLLVTLSNSIPGGKISMDTVSDNLLNKESRRKERGTNFQYEANVIENRGRGETRGKKESHGRNKSKAKDRSQSRTRTICYYCSEEGHKRFECRFLKKDQKVGTVHPNLVDPKKKDYTPTTFVVVDDNVFLIGEDNYLNVAYGDCSWIVSSASFHVSIHEDFFSNYKKGDYGTVKMGNHVTSKIIGIGDIVLLTDTSNKLE